MAKILNTVDEFNTQISQGTTLVDFYADWCGPCKMLAPIFEQVSTENTNTAFVKVNTDELGEIANKYEVRSIPTIIKFENGQEVARHVGMMGKDQLVDFSK
ncbi:thioredoxin [Spiroplasma culicicola]|uniref:Thioredoxin n=1 Tax=Spiroplasma culicicola AES-1 TaxID=1276246 RepID=W6A5S6_9MOLU|nr:thioredoxin [Spiroplasma culicicola]AHI52488.1 thioredoxin [Spiroplasma culicicola AES-1]